MTIKIDDDFKDRILKLMGDFAEASEAGDQKRVQELEIAQAELMAEFTDEDQYKCNIVVCAQIMSCECDEMDRYIEKQCGSKDLEAKNQYLETVLLIPMFEERSRAVALSGDTGNTNDHVLDVCINVTKACEEERKAAKAETSPFFHRGPTGLQ